MNHFQNAKKLYSEAGAEGDWQDVVNDIQTRHSRKKGFLLGLGLIDAGKSPGGPTFAERARERWRKQAVGEG